MWLDSVYHLKSTSVLPVVYVPLWAKIALLFFGSKNLRRRYIYQTLKPSSVGCVTVRSKTALWFRSLGWGVPSELG